MRYLEHIRRLFRRARDKHEAHRLCLPILQDISGDERFVTDALEHHLSKPGILNTRNFPVVGLDLDLNPDFGLLINCWIPRPDRCATTSTKAIHHHGDMLLSTATLLGPGYEHWLFGRPRLVDPDRELFELEVTSREGHPAHHVAFVDAQIPHLPWYPADTTLTLCLWSSQLPTTWKDHVKRVPLLKQNEHRLRRVVDTLGLRRAMTKAVDLKVVEYFDYYPTADGFIGMRERQEYERGPNEDHLFSLFHVIQRTGNEHLADLVEERLNAEPALLSREIVTGLLADLRAGRPIEGRLSECHFSLPHAVFSQGDVEEALRAVRTVGAR
jgi:hypothetical protein